MRYKLFATKNISSEFGSFKERQEIPFGKGRGMVPRDNAKNWINCGSAIIIKVPDPEDLDENGNPLPGNENVEIESVVEDPSTGLMVPALSEEQLAGYLAEAETFDESVDVDSEEAELAALASGQIKAGKDNSKPDPVVPRKSKHRK